MESLESILSELQNKYKNPISDLNPKKQEISEQLNTEKLPMHLAKKSIAIPKSVINSLDQLLQDLNCNSQNNTNYASTPQSISEVKANQTIPIIDRDLQQISDCYAARDQQAILKKASEWLQSLDPLCGEGLWFEEFAKNYSSRLEAAIALIQAK